MLRNVGKCYASAIFAYLLLHYTELKYSYNFQERYKRVCLPPSLESRIIMPSVTDTYLPNSIWAKGRKFITNEVIQAYFTSKEEGYLI